MDFIDFLTTYGNWGAYTLIVIGLVYAIKYLHGEIQELKQNEVTIRKAHYDDIKEMFTVMDKVGDWIDSKKYGQ